MRYTKKSVALILGIVLTLGNYRNCPSRACDRMWKGSMTLTAVAVVFISAFID
jgi:hypothetical protein